MFVACNKLVNSTCRVRLELSCSTRAVVFGFPKKFLWRIPVPLRSSFFSFDAGRDAADAGLADDGIGTHAHGEHKEEALQILEYGDEHPHEGNDSPQGECTAGEFEFSHGDGDGAYQGNDHPTSHLNTCESLKVDLTAQDQEASKGQIAQEPTHDLKENLLTAQGG